MKLLLHVIVYPLLLFDSIALNCNIEAQNKEVKSIRCSKKYKRCCTKAIEIRPGRVMMEMLCCNEGDCNEDKQVYDQLKLKVKCVECTTDNCNPKDADQMKGEATRRHPLRWIVLSSIVLRTVLYI